MTSDPRSGEKLRQAIDTLAQEYSDYETYKGAAIVDAFIPDETAAEIVQNLIGDVVFRFLLASAMQIRESSDPRTFDDSLDRFIAKKTRLTGTLAKRLRQKLKEAVLASEERTPKNERRQRIKDKQKNNSCYLCGGSIDGDSVLDHVWPRSAGGGNGKSNLRVAHPSCEAVKADYAVCGDVPVARFAFKSLPRTLTGITRSWWPSRIQDDEEFKSLVDDIRGSQLKIAVLGRQDFQCYDCQTPFHSSRNSTLIQRSEDEPWWFANVVAVCDECEKKGTK